MHATEGRLCYGQSICAASRAQIVPAIDSALKKYGSSDRSRKAKLHKDQPAHFRASTISAAEAQEQLQTQIDEFF